MANPHEERLLTLFADVHYYFSEPSPRPLHHRFDKESYVYLYRDPGQRRGRLEIANHAGTPEQDAFTGYLDSSKISQSLKHPNLCTVVVDGVQASTPTPSDAHHWRLPSTDPRDEGKFLFRLHTIDLYFWTHEDAQLFAQNVQHILQPHQLDIEAPPTQNPDPHAQAMSPIVQQLENIAIQDPAYQNGQTRNSRSTSGPAQAPAEAAKEEAAAYAPLAYNPAAPPAPETIKHREKTPPPPEAVGGTGLAAAALHDHIPPQGPGGFPPPPPGYQANSGYASSPSSGYGISSPGYGPGHQTPSVTSYTPGQTPVPGAHANPYLPQHTPGLASAHGSTGVTSPLASPSFAPPPRDPNAHLYSPGATPLESPATQIIGNSYVDHPKQPLQHLQPQYADYLGSRPDPHEPIGGYSDYKYDQEPARHHHHHASGDDYSIHSQVYRPTEEEVHSHGKHKPASGGQKPGKLEQKAEKAEKSVNRFLKKLEKKIG